MNATCEISSLLLCRALVSQRHTLRQKEKTLPCLGISVRISRAIKVSPAGIDQHGALLHGCQEVSVDKMMRLWCQRHQDYNNVGFWEKRLQFCMQLLLSKMCNTAPVPPMVRWKTLLGDTQ